MKGVGKKYGLHEQYHLLCFYIEKNEVPLICRKIDESGDNHIKLMKLVSKG